LIAAVLASGDEGEVRIPGEGRWACFEDNVAHGVPFEADTLKALEALAAECGVKTPWGDKEGAA
jgi:LDH2 family malate/lactate/ureidoglycolate dehydrogenase